MLGIKVSSNYSIKTRRKKTGNIIFGETMFWRVIDACNFKFIIAMLKNYGNFVQEIVLSRFVPPTI